MKHPDTSSRKTETERVARLLANLLALEVIGFATAIILELIR